LAPPLVDPVDDPVPLEYSIEWLTCAIASRLDVVMVGLLGAAQDRLQLTCGVLGLAVLVSRGDLAKDAPAVGAPARERGTAPVRRPDAVRVGPPAWFAGTADWRRRSTTTPPAPPSRVLLRRNRASPIKWLAARSAGAAMSARPVSDSKLRPLRRRHSQRASSRSAYRACMTMHDQPVPKTHGFAAEGVRQRCLCLGAVVL
jgi:hypothetical protein